MSGAALEVELDLRLPAADADFALGLGVYSEADEKCFEIFLESCTATFGPLAERATVRCALPALPLRPARYFVAVGLYPPGCDHIWDYHWEMHKFLVLGDAAGQVSGVLDVHPHWFVGSKEPVPQGHRARGS
jgi:lipopolysaccharide transport system ATP-binding protein